MSKIKHLLALTIGDKQGLSQWRVDLARYGIVHLMVISGLHIGLVAGLVKDLKFFSRIALFALSYSPFRVVRLNFLFYCLRWCLYNAIAYSLLAGFYFAHSTRVDCGGHGNTVQNIVFTHNCLWSFCLVAILIALFQPLAVLSASFWLSFCGFNFDTVLFPRIFSGAKFRQIFAAQGILWLPWQRLCCFLLARHMVGFSKYCGSACRVEVTVPLCLIAVIIILFGSMEASGIGWIVTNNHGDYLMLPPGWGL